MTLAWMNHCVSLQHDTLPKCACVKRSLFLTTITSCGQVDINKDNRPVPKFKCMNKQSINIGNKYT